MTSPSSFFSTTVTPGTPGSSESSSPSSTVPALLQGEGERTNSDVTRDAAWFKLGLDNGPDSAYWVNLHYLNMSKGLPPAIDEVRSGS